jgi:Tfp pilus assembly protein PilE
VFAKIYSWFMKLLIFRRTLGFTVVELMVMVAIIGILSAVAVPSLKKYQSKSRTTEARLSLSMASTCLYQAYKDAETIVNDFLKGAHQINVAKIKAELT